MYKCLGCGILFELGEEKEWYESVGEIHGTPCIKKVCGCPVCGERFEEVEPCKICGSYENMDYGDEYCKECKNDVLKRFSDFVNSEFTPEERDLLNDLYEGERI